MTTITCADCGAPYATKRHNTKYCEVCRTLRTLLYLRSSWKGRTRDCLICESEFLPLTRDDELCGDCDFIDGGKRTRGVCSLCEGERVLLHEDIRVCLGCGRDPEKRTLLIRALARKKAETQKRGEAVPA